VKNQPGDEASYHYAQNYADIIRQEVQTPSPQVALGLVMKSSCSLNTWKKEFQKWDINAQIL